MTTFFQTNKQSYGSIVSAKANSKIADNTQLDITARIPPN